MKTLFVFLMGVIIGAAILYFYCCKDSMDVEMTQPKGIITPAEAKTLDQAYNTRHQLISDSIVKRPDNRSSWYSVSDVRAYLASAEKQAAELGYTMNGVRIYLGAHAVAGNDVGYTTMLFIPTGTQTTAEGSMSPFNFMPPTGNHDIPGANGLDMGGGGNPPHANYPQ